MSTEEASDPETLRKERRLILLVLAVQFVNVLDFTMVMPLGPDFARELGIATSHIGIVGGIYTAAAAIAGFLGSVFLDRFDRRVALAVCLCGLSCATALGGASIGLGSLLASRFVAGAFGGPATALSLAIVADAVPPSRRGKALGSVMAAFSLASVLGMPIGLELARLLGWRAPFFGVAALGLVITFLTVRWMPRLHAPTERQRGVPTKPLRIDLPVVLSLGNIAILMLGLFAVVPNISAFVQHNLGYPRAGLGWLYLIGGATSFLSMRLTGQLVDRLGPLPLITVGTALHITALLLAFVFTGNGVPVWAIFTVFMVSGSVRMVAMQTIAALVPGRSERARFMSGQSAIQHVASALGAFSASAFLFAEPSGKLVGMERVAFAAGGLALIVPFGAFFVLRSLKARAAVDAAL